MKTMIKNYGWVIGVILLLWFYTFVLYVHDLGNAGSGQFGDMFGAINTLFSGLAFAFVIIALLQQQKQFERQAFETGFFELLKLFRQNVDALQISSQKEIISGKLVLGILKSKLESELRKLDFDENEKWSKDALEEAYGHFYKDHECRLGDYFRLLFQLMQFVKESKCLDAQGRRRYGNLVRAGLNANELFLLYFNGLSEVGHGSRDYISRFRMFAHLNLGWAKERLLSGLYPPSAFGKQSEGAGECLNDGEG